MPLKIRWAGNKQSFSSWTSTRRPKFLRVCKKTLAAVRTFHAVHSSVWREIVRDSRSLRFTAKWSSFLDSHLKSNTFLMGQSILPRFFFKARVYKYTETRTNWSAECLVVRGSSVVCGFSEVVTDNSVGLESLPLLLLAFWKLHEVIHGLDSDV